MKPIPKKITFRNYTYKVKRLKKIKRGKLRGEVDLVKRIIRIEKSDNEREWHDFLHEVIHVNCDIIKDSDSTSKATAVIVDSDEVYIDDEAALIAQLIRPFIEGRTG